ncbi:hypothetical protein CC80DRAFT_533617 [Byssothecium circinans]|uniref:Uncharacterized protein n=1 Tax=Byssothecium circinans TaxID=147558 RepID=A0A6A5U135_9PLEO|nr:hypothetical protein CC80DRAFT_533617 [Byssothecium circinans]
MNRVMKPRGRAFASPLDPSPPTKREININNLNKYAAYLKTAAVNGSSLAANLFLIYSHVTRLYEDRPDLHDPPPFGQIDRVSLVLEDVESIAFRKGSGGLTASAIDWAMQTSPHTPDPTVYYLPMTDLVVYRNFVSMGSDEKLPYQTMTKEEIKKAWRERIARSKTLPNVATTIRPLRPDSATTKRLIFAWSPTGDHFVTVIAGGGAKERYIFIIDGHTVFSQPTRGFGQRAPHSVSADFTLNFNPLYLNQYGSN